MLCVGAGGNLSDQVVRDLPAMLRKGDCLIFNDTRVIPAQLQGRRGDATIGATLHKRIDLRRWQAFIRNAKRLHPGDSVEFGHGVSATAEERHDDGSFTLHNPVGTLIMTGGTDVSTGLAFTGTLKAPEGSTVVTPLTTLITSLAVGGVSAADATLQVAAAFHLEGVELTTFDPVPTAIGGILGVATMLAIKKLGQRWKGPTGMLSAIGIDLFVDGVVLGLAFLAGVKLQLV